VDPDAGLNRRFVRPPVHWQNRPIGALPPEWPFEDQDLQRMHDNLIELRHETIAHSDADFRRILIVPPGFVLGAAPVASKGGVAVTTSNHPLRISSPAAGSEPDSPTTHGQPHGDSRRVPIFPAS
jgi:hypothetical protein